MLYLLTGTIQSVGGRNVEVKLHNTGQIISVVKGNQLELDEREEEADIDEGTEVLVISDDLGNAYAVNSISQAITIAGNGKKAIRNKVIEITGKKGAIADKTEIYTTKLKMRNESDDLVDLVSQLAQLVADTTPDGGSSSGKPNLVKAEALAVKAKIDAFK